MVSDTAAGVSERLNACVRCGNEYEPYTVFIADDLNSILEYVTTKREWNLHEGDNDGLCKPCRVAVAPNGYFSGAGEVEPKETLDTDDDPEIRTDGGVEESDNERWIHPLERLKEKAEEAAERREKEVVSCPECGTEVLKESFDDAVETAINHDEKRHDGAGVTRINGMDVPSDDLAEVVEDAIQHLSTDNRSEESP